MAIDRIGKAPAPVPQEGPRSERGRANAEFSVPAGPSEVRAEPVEAPQLSPLERLRHGEIGISEYLDMKVQVATRHLGGMPQSDLLILQDVLRNHIASDPALGDLAERATGVRPEIPEE